MEMLQKILMWIALPSAVVLASAGVAVLCSQRGLFPGRWLLCAFRKLPWPSQIFLLAFVMRMVVHGSIKTNVAGGVEEDARQRGRDIPVACNKEAATFFSRGRNAASPLGADDVDDSDIARGYRLVEVSTNADYSYAMPTNAVLCGHWHQRGAYDDVTLVDFGNWSFLHGSNEVCRLWAFTWGMARAEIRDVAHEIAPVGAPMSAIPDVSRLWTASTTNGTRLLTWESFAVGRILRDELEQSLTDENRFLSAQIELSANGDFITRSNDLAVSYRRVDPDDWDGDGWTNDEDPDPKRWTGGDFGLAQSLPEGANAAAYYWIDIRVPYNTPVSFVGDAPSSLADPSFIARAGETCRVYLLVGKRYEVTSVRPVSVVAQSTDEAIVCGEGSPGMSVVYPVDIYAMEGNGSGFRMVVSPAELGGVFEWTESCCPITGYGECFWYAHAGQCFCGGCYAEGRYAYEGYSLPCEGGYCGCPYHDADDSFVTRVDDGPYAEAVSASFSSPAVIFEDTYTNRPGEVVARRSTRTTLTCTAHGGERGVTASFSVTGGNRLVRVSGGLLPVTRFVPPGQKLEFEIEYEGCRPSDSEGDIVAIAVMSGDGVQQTTATDELTSVRVELTAVYDAPENHNPSRHIYGVGERIELRHWPLGASVVWDVDVNDVFSELEDADLCDKLLRLHFLECATMLDASYAGVRYRPTISLVEPQGVSCRECAWDGTCIAKGLAGGVGMNLRLYIIPMCVSFQGIDVAEIPCDTIIPPTGYYATTNFNGVLSHSLEAEAGDWHHVKDGNYWCTDNAVSNIRRPEWTDGTMIWNIPIQWYQRLEATESWTRGDIHADGRLIGGSESAYQQRFDISSAGTVRVTKHQHWVERTTDDVIRLDGDIVHWGIH